VQNKKRKKWPWILLAVLTAFVAVIAIARDALNKAANQAVYKNYEVTKGSITESVTATGVMFPKDTEELKLPSGYRIDEVLVSPGEYVKAGQALAALDVNTLSDISLTLSNEVTRLDSELARLSRGSKSESVYSPAEGRVKMILCSEGDDVDSVIAKNGALIVISADEKMRFEISTDKDIELKTEVTVVLEDGKEKTGLLESKTTGGYIVTLPDNGPKAGEKVQAVLDGTSLGEGTLAVNAPVAVLAEGGTVGTLNVKENEKVNRGEKLITLEDEPFTSSYQSAFNSRTETAEKAAAVLEFIANPIITAPREGVIREILASDGQTLAGAAGDEQTVFLIDVGGAVKLVAQIDELDIDLIKFGQKAKVTADALGEEEFDAEITDISRLGNNVNGITTYDVTMELQPDERLYSGMNAACTVVISERDDVLLIPLEIIEEDENGEFVYVVKDVSKNGKDRVRVNITTGLSDGINAEVTSGLSEGDLVNYEYVSAMEATMMRFMGNNPNRFQNRGFGNDPNE
jgi:HlyD family secretion protein